MDHLGIDVHKKDSQMSILAEGRELIEQRIPTEPERFAAVLGAFYRRLAYRVGKPKPSPPPPASSRSSSTARSRMGCCTTIRGPPRTTPSTGMSRSLLNLRTE